MSTSSPLHANQRLGDRASTPPSYAVATWLAGHAPYWMLYCVSRVGGGVHYVLSANKRRAYLSNTAGVVRFNNGARPWTSFQNQALNVLELLRVGDETPESLLARFTLHGREHIERALDAGRGIVLATFHSGNWELSGLMLALSGFPITTVAGEQLRPGWSDAVKSLKRRTGIRVLSPDASLRELFRDLEDNRAIALHVDGNLFHQGTPVRFLGRDIVAPLGPARLARVMGAPVALTYCRRRDRDQLHVHVEEPFAAPLERGDEGELTDRLMTCVEKRIVEEPSQWCIFRKL